MFVLVSNSIFEFGVCWAVVSLTWVFRSLDHPVQAAASVSYCYFVFFVFGIRLGGLTFRVRLHMFPPGGLQPAGCSRLVVGCCDLWDPLGVT